MNAIGGNSTGGVRQHTIEFVARSRYAPQIDAYSGGGAKLTSSPPFHAVAETLCSGQNAAVALPDWNGDEAVGVGHEPHEPHEPLAAGREASRAHWMELHRSRQPGPAEAALR